MSAVRKNERSRGWCFTHNNPTVLDRWYLLELYRSRTDIQYVIGGSEVGKKGTPHIQGFIYFKDAKTFTKVKSLLFDDCHIEAQKAKEALDAIVYCMKDNNYVEFGDRPHGGRRTDLEVIRHDIDSGKPMKNIARDAFSQWCQYSRQFKEYRDMTYVGRFTTQLIVYKLDDLPLLYGLLPTLVNPYVVECSCELLPDKVMHLVHQGKYDYIFYPDGVQMSQRPYCDYWEDIRGFDFSPVDIDAENGEEESLEA